MAHDNGRVRGIPRCQASERVSDTHVEFAQALATGPMHVEIFVGKPCSEVGLMGADVLERPPLVRAEVQLSNVRTDFDRQIPDIGGRLRGFPGAQQWARDDDIRSAERSDVRHNRRGLLVPQLIEWDVSPPDEYAADVAPPP